MMTYSTFRSVWNGIASLLVAAAIMSGDKGALVRAADTTKPALPAQPLRHAHNDYHQPRPLHDALSRGFHSVEADVVLHEGELLVGHFVVEAILRKQTLEDLYLKPLRERIAAQQGKVQDDPPFFLLIDIKTDGEATYRAIHAQLEKFADILSVRKGGKWTPGPVTVVISGNVPRSAMLKQEVCYAGIDGRPHDLESELPAHVMPWISTDWKSLSAWNGQGSMPEAEREQLRSYVAAAHNRGRLVRFWATPETEDLWKELHNQQVDLIGTDQLSKLEAFCQQTAATSDDEKN